MSQHRERYTVDFWTRLTELSKLQPGWLDGEGVPPKLEILEIAGRIGTALPHGIGKVYAYPTVEGGALLEWADDDASHSIEIRADKWLELLTVEKDRDLKGESS